MIHFFFSGRPEKELTVVIVHLKTERHHQSAVQPSMHGGCPKTNDVNVDLKKRKCTEENENANKTILPVRTWMARSGYCSHETLNIPNTVERSWRTLKYIVTLPIQRMHKNAIRAVIFMLFRGMFVRTMDLTESHIFKGLPML
jgi:hypothetical protein